MDKVNVIINKIVVNTNSGKICLHCKAHSYPIDPNGNDLTNIDGDWVDDTIEHEASCIYYDLMQLRNQNDKTICF